jgi:pimeloyl-ACP methyl ester carboxylesterase
MATKLGWEPRWYDPSLGRWLHRIKVPTLVIWGADDRLFPQAYIKPWVEGIPGARGEIIRECGHLIHVEKAAEATALITQFIGGR